MIMNYDNYFENELKKDNYIFNINNGEFLFGFNK